MRPALFPAVLTAALLLFPSASNAAWGKTKEEQKTALLWLPDQSKLDWRSLENLLLKHPDASLTVALIPAEIPEAQRPWLAERVKEGRLEIALRLAGDPLLPLIHGYRRRDVIDRVALARVEYKKIFGEDPNGFVPGAGALSAETAKFLEMQKIRWAAVGDAAFRTPWYSSPEGTMNVVPFHVPESTAPVALASLHDIRAIVLDETSGAVAPGLGIDVLAALFEDTRNDRWTGVGLSMPNIQPYAVGPEFWPPFSGDLADWTEGPLQAQAWRLYELAAAALERYKNSGTARLHVLNKAAESLYLAQSSFFFRPDSLRSAFLERRFRAHLSKVFRTLGMTPPAALRQRITAVRSPLAPPPPPIAASGTALSDAFETQEPGDGTPERDEETESIRSTVDDASLLFENPEDSTASVPARLPDLPPGTTAAHLWTPESLRVIWGDESVALTFKMKDLLERGDAPLGFEALLLELYIDLNRLARRGSTSLLPERKGFLPSMDAWEYAVVVHGWGAALYRSVPGQPPALVEPLNASADPKEDSVRVVIPRARLRGNPNAWGYLLLALATDEGLAREGMPRPLDGADGSPLLGILGPLKAQRKLMGSRSAYRRVSPVRAADEDAIPAR